MDFYGIAAIVSLISIADHNVLQKYYILLLMFNIWLIKAEYISLSLIKQATYEFHIFTESCVICYKVRYIIV